MKSVSNKVILFFALSLIGLSSQFIALPAHAVDFRSGDDVTIRESETINEDLYIAGGNITVTGTVNGDVLIAGGNVWIDGAVNGDVLAMGGMVSIRGVVSDDVRAAGGQVRVSGTIEDNLAIAGGSVDVASDGIVNGETTVASGDLRLSGTTQDVRAAVGNVTVAESARINGDLTYWSDGVADVSPGATITGTLQRRDIPGQEVTQSERIISFIISTLATALFAYFFILLFPNKSTALVDEARRRPGWSILWGLVFLVVVPISIFLLMISVVGIPLALVALMLYLALLYLGYLATVVIVGEWITRGVAKIQGKPREKARTAWVAPLVGAIVLAIAGLVPVIGWVAVCVAFLIGLGALITYDTRLYKSLRESRSL